METYKDLILCCATKYGQRDYFVCNPITKQWVALPPTPQIYDDFVEVVFVCDPYYYDGGELQEQQNITSTTMSRVTVINPEYTWKVVRLVPNLENGNINVDIFSSKSSDWMEVVALRTRHHRHLCSVFVDERSSAVAYKGKVYWYYTHGIIFELDLEGYNYYNKKTKKKNKNIAKCRFIKLPERVGVEGCVPHLVLSGGHLRLYTFILTNDNNQQHSLRAWELKEVVKDDQAANTFEFKWLVDEVSLIVQDENLSLYGIPSVQSVYSRNFWVLDLHQHNEDIIYFQSKPYLVTCSIHGGRLEILTKVIFDGLANYSYPFVFPLWPTPVHI